MNAAIIPINIADISRQLTNPQINQQHADKLITQAFQHFEMVVNLPQYAEGFTHYATVPTGKGKALSLIHAAQCFVDFDRTRNFVMCIKEAIDDKLETVENRPLHIFYAGCGPLAPFITLIAPIYTPEQVTFSLLEVNETSMKVAKELVNHLELDSFVKAYYVEDATSFQIPSPENIDIVISETLDSLLYREAYVPIRMNFDKQVPRTTTFIPENTNIKLFLKQSLNGQEFETPYAEIFNTTKQIQHFNDTNRQENFFPSVELPIQNNPNYKSIVFDTEVHIYKNTYLNRGKSSISLPFEMTLEHPLKYNKLVFTYELEPECELKCDFETA